MGTVVVLLEPHRTPAGKEARDLPIFQSDRTLLVLFLRLCEHGNGLQIGRPLIATTRKETAMPTSTTQELRVHRLITFLFVVCSLTLLAGSTFGQSARFRRGDANVDGLVDLTDAIHVLKSFHIGDIPLECEDAADADDDSQVTLTDGIFLFAWHFAEGREPPAPSPFRCGVDPTPDGLGCVSYPQCSNWDDARFSDNYDEPVVGIPVEGELTSVLNLESDVAAEDQLLPIASYDVTISGRVVYNDLRTIGHFEWRKDLAGSTGAQVAYTSSATNYLGALDVVADFYELDSVGWSPLHWNCDSEEYLGSATLDSEGRFSKSLNVSGDNCGADDDERPDIGVRFRLRFCNSTMRCFSVEDDDRDTYVLWHPDAYPDNPLEVSSGSYELDTMGFQTTSGGHDDYAKAASVYASLVEATRVWHREEEIPFDPRGDGEVYARFPSSYSSVATAQNDHRIHIPQPSNWTNGKGVYHEYGHIIHMRAWNGTTGSCGDCPGGDDERGGNPSWGPEEREYPNTAFAEGWASFVNQVIQSYPDQACGGIDDGNSLDPNSCVGNCQPICNADPNQYPDTNNPVTYPNDGKSYPGNVTKLLCDWYDVDDDNDSNMAGGGDDFTASLHSVWYNLQQMWDWVDDRNGLQICDYIDYYLNGRKSSANVGSSTHEQYVASIADLAYNNGLKCGLDEPGTASTSNENVCTEDYLCWEVADYDEFYATWQAACEEEASAVQATCQEAADRLGSKQNCGEAYDSLYRECMMDVKSAWKEYQNAQCDC